MEANHTLGGRFVTRSRTGGGSKQRTHVTHLKTSKNVKAQKKKGNYIDLSLPATCMRSPSLKKPSPEMDFGLRWKGSLLVVSVPSKLDRVGV